MDIGQPKDFVTGVGMYLSYLADNHPAKLSKGDNFVGNVLVVRVLFSCVLYMYILTYCAQTIVQVHGAFCELHLIRGFQ